MKLPRRYQYLNELLKDSSSNLPIQWIESFLKEFVNYTSVDKAWFLWEELQELQLNNLTTVDKTYVKGLQDMVMEYFIEMEQGTETTDYYFYLYTILYMKTFPNTSFNVEWMQHTDSRLNELQNYLKNLI
jgi:hypothetical protein